MREGEFRSPIALPCAHPHGSDEGGLGSLFALNPDARGEGSRDQTEGGKNQLWKDDQEIAASGSTASLLAMTWPAVQVLLNQKKDTSV